MPQVNPDLRLRDEPQMQQLDERVRRSGTEEDLALFAWRSSDLDARQPVYLSGLRRQLPRLISCEGWSWTETRQGQD